MVFPKWFMIAQYLTIVLFLDFFWHWSFVAKIRLTLVHLPQATGWSYEICLFIEHRNGPMVLVVCDQTFFFFCVVLSVIYCWEIKWHIRQHMVWIAMGWGSLLSLITKNAKVEITCEGYKVSSSRLVKL